MKGSFTPPGGDDQEIQVNDGGRFAGATGLTFDSVTKLLSVPKLNLSLRQRVSKLNAGAAGWMMAYNGNANSGTYSIGTAYSRDGKRFTKPIRNPIITVGAGGSYDSNGVFMPNLRRLNDIYYIFYSGYNGATRTMGLYTSPDGNTWTKKGRVLNVGGGGAWDSQQAYSGLVEIDEEDVPAKRFKMWYLGYNGSVYAIGYAYSADGENWTKYAGNPVLTVGGAGAWDELIIDPGCVYKDGSTWYLIYEGYPAAGTTSSIGVATFTNPESSYTKYASNPVLTPRITAIQALTANLVAGNSAVIVGDTSVFHVNEPVYINDLSSTTNDELCRIKSIDSPTQLTLWAPVVNNYATASTAKIRSVYDTKLSPNSIHIQDGTFKIYGSAYGNFSDRGRETVAAFTANSPTSGWAFDYDSGSVVTLYDSATAWDRHSAENPSLIPSPGAEELNFLQKGAMIDLANRFTLSQTIGPLLANWDTGNFNILQVGERAAIMASKSGGVSEFSSNSYWDGSTYRRLALGAVSKIAFGSGTFVVSTAGSGAAASSFGYTDRLTLDNNGNFGIGATTFGTSAAGVVAVASAATLPSTSPADMVQAWSADAAAGDAQLFTRNEAGKVERLTGLSCRVSSQFDKTTNTTLADIPGLSFNVEAGKTYTFEAVLFLTADVTGGSKYAIAGTATATAIIYQIELMNNTTSAYTITSRQVALAGSAGQAGTTTGLCTIRGTITVNAAGSLTVQFAQNASNLTSSILVGSYFKLRQQ